MRLSRKACVFLLTCLASASFISAQSATPKPTPDDDVVKINTNVIQLDVSVTDTKGRSIADLKQDEVEIFENGQKQKITGFKFVSSVSGAVPQTAPTPIDGVPVPPPVARAENIRRTIAVVVDDLALSFESAYQTRRALKKFVDEQMQPGDLVAIIRTGAGVGALQQFTSDKRILYAAIERVKWNPLGGAGIGAFAPIEPTTLETAAANGVEVSEEELADEANRANSVNDFRAATFATGTLGALRYIVNGMADLPGRKSIILLSEGFRLLERDSSGFTSGGSVLDFLRLLVDEANRKSIVFYTIDPRGLQTASITAEDNTAGLSPQAVGQRVADRTEQLTETQAGLDMLAHDTGGISIKNNNDIAGGLRRIVDDQSYYLIAYEPDEDTFDPAKRRFNKIDVRVSRSGAKARYRSGFFNVAEKPETPTTAVNVAAPGQQIKAALLSPFAVGGITLRLNALFGNEPKGGSYVRSLLHIDAGDLTFVDAPGGKKKAEFDVLAVAFGDNGQPVDQIGKSYIITVKPENQKAFTDTGFVYSFVFPVKKAGAYQYRVAIRDINSGKAGSASQFVEIPDVKKDRLTLSGVVLEGLTPDQWTELTNVAGRLPQTDPASDTALRRVHAGSVLRFAYEIYNPTLVAGRSAVTAKVRVFRDTKLILDGQNTPVDAAQTDPQRLKMSGALALGKTMLPGEYILQIIVTDPNAKVRSRIATQIVQFEVVE